MKKKIITFLVLFLGLGILGNISHGGFWDNKQDDFFDLIENNSRVRQSNYQLSNGQSVVNWLHKNGMTIYTSYSKYRPLDGITREEAAKMLSIFATMNKRYHIKSASECIFSDVPQGRWSYSYIKDACMKGFFNGSKRRVRGRTYRVFNPTNNLTYGEAFAVLYRISFGRTLKEGGVHWSTPYAADFFKRGIQPKAMTHPAPAWFLNKSISRIELGKLIEASDYHKNTIKPVIDAVKNDIYK